MELAGWLTGRVRKLRLVDEQLRDVPLRVWVEALVKTPTVFMYGG
jgi:hypothetical protein